MKQLLNFINGEFTAPSEGRFFPSFNPATGVVHLEVSDSTAADVDCAVAAAKAAFRSWSRLSVSERAGYLYRIADGVDARAAELAQAESADQGKPVWLASRLDIPRAAHNLRFFAGAVLHSQDLATAMGPETFNYISRKPVGVAGLISPWNLPLYLLTWKIAPALATGNTAVCKPSELTSHTAFLFAEICRDAGLPKGVVNFVFGDGIKVGTPLVLHPDVPLISFTGGTVTGQKIAQMAAPSLKKLSLELGGKNANLIFDDADLDLAVTTTLRSSFLNQGEICLCGSRIYVQEKVYDEFKKRFTAETKKLKCGNPQDESSFIGALVSKEHLQKVRSYIDLAISEGAEILCGASAPKLNAPFDQGYFLEPTILTSVAQSSRVQQEEIFGPVVTLTPFKSDQEGITLANDCKYGLSASVWTQSLKRAHSVAAQLDVGTVWVNTWMMRDLRAPFGGVKASGRGREGQDHSLEFFTEAKTICIQHGEIAP
jgi:acyl-CoA reductase-like NAD-dependent aldehyde dehydrogenase